MGEDWQLRELEKFEQSKVYMHVPWLNESWASHYPEDGTYGMHRDSQGKYPFYRFTHVSVGSPAKLAYTQDFDKGERDIQTKARVGRYLKKFYPSLGDQVIKDWVTFYTEKYGTICEVKFATTPDEIEYVYNNGPESCMKKSSFLSEIHPCRIYGAGDLAIVYMERNARITSRAVCWPDKKVFTTVYGDRDRLVPALTQLDYVSGGIEGARLLQIEYSGSKKHNRIYVAPYLDGSSNKVSVCDKFNYIGSHEKAIAKFIAAGTNGLGSTINFCAICVIELDSRHCHSFNDETFCKTHFYEVAFTCCNCGYHKSIREDRLQIDGNTWCYSCYIDSYFTCDVCYTPKRHHRLAGITKNGEHICTRCVSTKSNNLKKCRRCEVVNNRDTECNCGVGNGDSASGFIAIDNGTVTFGDSTWTHFTTDVNY